MSRTPDISIIICTRNRAESLRQTLLSLDELIVPNGLSAELIVVDNGSTDSTEKVVCDTRPRHIPARTIAEFRPGLSFARNAGLAAAHGDIVLFTDDDVRAPATWMEQMAAPILVGSAQAVAGAVRLAPHLSRPWMRARHRAHLADTARLGSIESNPASHKSEAFWPSLDKGGALNSVAKPELVGANMGFARDVLPRVPGFDTELGAGTGYAGEETLFSMQLAEAGYRIVLAAGEPIEHHIEEKRLARTCFLSEVARSGRFFAYADYHWEHRSPKWPAFRLERSRIRLAGWRAFHPSEARREEGAAVREMEHVFAVSYFEEFQRLCGSARKYGRHGLVKRAGYSEPLAELARAA